MFRSVSCRLAEEGQLSRRLRSATMSQGRVESQGAIDIPTAIGRFGTGLALKHAAITLIQEPHRRNLHRRSAPGAAFCDDRHRHAAENRMSLRLPGTEQVGARPLDQLSTPHPR
jgi:hypothetical protein